MNINYQTHNHYNCIEDYHFPKDIEEWHECPNCGLKPKIWTFDNGKSTACGCWSNKYSIFSIYAESIMSYIKRNNGSAEHYDFNELKHNWNHWVESGEVLFEHASKRKDGRW